MSIIVCAHILLISSGEWQYPSGENDIQSKLHSKPPGNCGIPLAYYWHDDANCSSLLPFVHCCRWTQSKSLSFELDIALMSSAFMFGRWNTSFFLPNSIPIQFNETYHNFFWTCSIFNKAETFLKMYILILCMIHPILVCVIITLLQIYAFCQP